MKLFPHTLLFLTACFSFTLCPAADDGYHAKQSQFVRVSNNDDGSRTVFKRMPGDKELHKYTYDPDGRLVHMARYVTDKFGAIIGCFISDGKKNILFKVAYVYNRQGQLVEEYMYEADTKALVSIFQYNYDELGKRSEPRCIVVKKGDDPDNRFKFRKATALDKDPFSEENNPKMRGTPLKK